MAYEGEILNYCPSSAYTFSDTSAVVVSGATWNPCGHLILNVGGRNGVYLHVAGIHDYPRYMNEEGYQRYLRENGKREIRRTPVRITDINAAMLKLEYLLASKWTWGVLPHNCASFVEEIVQAGGSTAGLWLNCPSRGTFD